MSAMVDEALAGNVGAAYLQLANEDAGQYIELVWSFLGHRALSMVAQHQGRFECYADMLPSVPERQNRVAANIQASWAALLGLAETCCNQPLVADKLGAGLAVRAACSRESVALPL